jgi:hypothetical protein
MDVNDLAKLVQGALTSVPTLVLGSGASVSLGIPGMPLLAEALAASRLPDSCNTKQDQDGWANFLDYLSHTDLESALTKAPVTEAVTNHIVLATWQFLNEPDVALFHDVVTGKRSLALSNLFRYLFRSTEREINVVTPNYDRVAEYAAEMAGYPAFTGFAFGMMGERAAEERPQIAIGRMRVRTVNVWKVHGSFGWHQDAQGVIRSLPPMEHLPATLTPMIVTPGVDKYKKTYGEPFRTIMHAADQSMRSAHSFLCVGYGFNDPHMQTELTERCDRHHAPLVLITKQISATAHTFLQSGKCRKFVAIQEHAGGVKVFTEAAPDGEVVEGPPYWDLAAFLSLLSKEFA